MFELTCKTSIVLGCIPSPRPRETSEGLYVLVPSYAKHRDETVDIPLVDYLELNVTRCS